MRIASAISIIFGRSTISPEVRFRMRPISPVAQKAQATVLALTQKTVAGAKACKAELTLKGKAAFATVYGSKANAFGVCVSRKLAA